MKSIAVFLMFVGTILIIQGYYNNIAACPAPKPIIKYVPRSTYEEQMSSDTNLLNKYQNMFESSGPRPI
jgi:hypothetical protein